MTPRGRILAAALAACCLLATAWADRDAAKFFSQRADKAAAAKKWDEAEEQYRKALEQDEEYLPARYGLAQTLVGAGRSGVGIEELRTFIDAAHVAGAALPAEWKPLLAKAEKQIVDLDAAGAALQKLASDQADLFAALGERWLTKDPELAERALRRALLLKPGHVKATQGLEKLGKSASGEETPLFNGKTFAGWEAANQPEWQIQNGCIVGESRDATFFCRVTKSYEGDFDVRLEGRITESYGTGSILAVMTCWQNTYDYYSMGAYFGRIDFWDVLGQNNKPRDIGFKLPPDTKKKWDPLEWHVYEVRHRGDTATALMDGEEIASEKRPANRKGGFIGILMQNAHVQVRKLVVEKR